MIRHLLATTALAGLLATSALAQNAATPADPAAPAATAPADTTASAAKPAGDYVQKLEADQYLASKLTGTNLYEGDAADARSIGEIQNFVIGNDGKVAAAVIATSGLDNDKTVAAPIDKIDWKDDGNGSQRAILKADIGELQGAPEFVQQTPQDAANSGAAVPGSGAATTAGGPADSSASNVTTAPTADTTTAANSAAAGGSTPAQPGNSASMQAGGNGYLAALGNDQRLSQNVIGSNVYSGPGDDAQTIGSVNDLVLAKSGEIPAVIVGVGGFLGIGEKNVGVPYAEVTMQPGSEDEPRLLMAATKEQLTAAPTFDTGDRNAQTAANTGTGGAPATGTGMTGSDQMAQTVPVAPGATTANGQNAEGNSAMNADTSTTASTGGSNDRSSMQPISGPELTADNLNGVSVYGPNDQNIGKVGDIALASDGKVDAVVVDVGGFLGIGSKPVAVAMDNLQFMRDTNGTVNIYTQFTEDQLKNAPEFNRENYAQNRSTMRLEQGSVPAPAGGASSGAMPAGGNQPAQ